MGKYFLTFVLLLTTSALSAKTTLLGKVVDATSRKEVGYATVALLRDTTIVAAVAARADGSFLLETEQSGKMTLEVSSVGYNTHKQQVEAANKRIDLGEIALTEGVAVDAVNITVQKPIVTADAEKLTYSVEDDPEASTSTLEDIIRKVPQLSLDASGNVLIHDHLRVSCSRSVHSSIHFRLHRVRVEALCG